MTEDELDRIVVGDVLRTPSGDYRVVRKVSVNKNKRAKYYGQPGYFAFAIRRCSWTGRAVTYLGRSDIRHWSRVGVRVRLDGDIDRKLDFEVSLPKRSECELTCCDVKGVP